jgi:hypothetical protein
MGHAVSRKTRACLKKPNCDANCKRIELRNENILFDCSINVSRFLRGLSFHRIHPRLKINKKYAFSI